MAEIRPFRAWRYNQELSSNIESYLSPLFDVVTNTQRELLYQNPYNSIHLSVPNGPDAAQNAANTLNSWKQHKVIQQDFLPGIYPYYQKFNLPGHVETYCRKGFVCFIRAYQWHENVVLRHENTIPAAVQDRVDLLRKTELNASPTHFLYSDPGFQLEALLDESMQDPIIETEDYQGVKELLSVIHNAGAIKKIVEVLKDQQVILADGHHRYQGSIDYRKYRAESNNQHTGTEGYNYHLVYLTNMEAPDLRILATHRLLSGLPALTEARFLEQASAYFEVSVVDTPYEINEIILGKPSTFGVVTKENTYKLVLKPGLDMKIEWPFPDIIKKLDLTVLHYYILEKIWGIAGKHQRNSRHIDYDRNFTDCVTRVKQGDSQMAIITNELTMDQVKEVCFSGYTLPQKSTYFYPKAICGLLFGSIKEDEFQLSHYPGF